MTPPLPPGRPVRARAFTLLEMAVSLAMAGAIAAVAVGAGMHVNRALVETRRRSQVWDEAKRLEEAVLSLVQEAGGDPMPAWASVFVEDACDEDVDRKLPSCDGADRITVLSAEPNRPICRVQVSGATLQAVVSGSGTCCLAGFSGSTTASAVLMTDANEAVTATLTSLNLSSCSAVAAPGHGNPTPGTFADGRLALMRAVTLFPRRKAGTDKEYELMAWVDRGVPGTPPDGEVGEGELVLIADRVFDFQIALGYDHNPEDGDVVENGSTTDEFFGNAEAVAPSSAPFVRDQLRMIDVAVAVGTPGDRFTGEPFRLHNRSQPLTIAGHYVAIARGQVAFRNLNVSLP
jgi:type II secretory pathway pseudopilin PulG